MISPIRADTPHGVARPLQSGITQKGEAMKSQKVNQARVSALAAGIGRVKAPIVEFIGTERVQALRQNPEQVHSFPRTQRSMHTASRDCSCRPSLSRPQWWQLEVTHWMIGTEGDGGPDDDEWSRLRQADRAGATFKRTPKDAR
jgi:hypothetical protein